MRPIFVLLFILLAPFALAVDIDTLEKSVVRIFVQVPDGIGTGSGSIVARGLVLTNDHVVSGADSIQVRSKHIPSALEARVQWRSSDLDLALLQVDGLNLPSVTLATQKPRKGEGVWALGYPGASDSQHFIFDATVTRGVVSLFRHQSWDGSGTKLWIIQHDAAINPGNSGGPLFDDCGRVVGVNTASIKEDARGISLASRITEAIPHLESKGARLQKGNDVCSPASGGGVSGLDPVARQKASKAWFISLITGLGIGVLSLLAIALALHKPRQQVVKVIERVSRISNKYLPSPPPPRNAKSRASKHAALVLAGFDTSGKKLRILIPKQGTSTAQGGYVLGRHAALVDHVVEDTNISRRHARITMEDGGCRIEDLNSTNGTQVNGHKLAAFVPTPIAPGDVICFGAIQMQASSGG